MFIDYPSQFPVAVQGGLFALARHGFCFASFHSHYSALGGEIRVCSYVIFWYACRQYCSSVSYIGDGIFLSFTKLELDVFTGSYGFSEKVAYWHWSYHG